MTPMSPLLLLALSLTTTLAIPGPDISGFKVAGHFSRGKWRVGSAITPGAQRRALRELQSKCLAASDGLCDLNPNFVTSLAAPQTDTAKLTGYQFAIMQRCSSFSGQAACNAATNCWWDTDKQLCNVETWVDPRWWKDRVYCTDSLYEREIVCEASSRTRDGCGGSNCTWISHDEFVNATHWAFGSGTAGLKPYPINDVIRSSFRYMFVELGVPGFTSQRQGGLCVYGGLWDASFEPVVYKGVLAALPTADKPDFREIVRAVAGDVFGACPADMFFVRIWECAYEESQAACEATGPYCHWVWSAPGVGSCSVVDPNVDVTDPYWRLVQEVSNTCRRADNTTCATAGGTIRTGVTAWDTLLSSLPSFATGNSSGGAGNGLLTTSPSPEGGRNSPGAAGAASVSSFLVALLAAVLCALWV